MIASFNKEFRFLSNFAPSVLWVNGLVFPTLEHAYQVYRATNSQDREKIRTAINPGRAKRIAHSVEQSTTFHSRKVDIMLNLLEKKFKDSTLRARLEATGTQELVEGNYWHDNFWGNCTCPDCGDITGENMLGKLLMQVRGEP